MEFDTDKIMDWAMVAWILLGFATWVGQQLTGEVLLERAAVLVHAFFAPLFLVYWVGRWFVFRK